MMGVVFKKKTKQMLLKLGFINLYFTKRNVREIIMIRIQIIKINSTCTIFTQSIINN